MIVIGGMDEEENISDSIFGLNIETFHWQKYKCQGNAKIPICNHKCLPMFRGELIMDSLNDKYEIKNIKQQNFVMDEEGVIIFGGRMQNGDATN